MSKGTTPIAILALLIVTACTSSGETRDPDRDSPAPAQLIEPVADHAPLKASAKLSKELHQEVEIVQAGVSSGVPSGNVANLMVANAAPTLMTAFTPDGKVAARGVVLAIEGAPTKPAELSYASTAFTRFLTSTKFLTSDAPKVAYLRGLVEELPAFGALARALEEAAAVNPDWDSEPTEAQGKALMRLVEQADARLRALGRQLPRQGAARPSPGWGSDGDCLRLTGYDGEPNRICAQYADGEAKGRSLHISNAFAAWYAVRTRGGQLVDLVPPGTVQLPILTDVVTEAVKGTAIVVSKGGVEFACSDGFLASAGRALTNPMAFGMSRTGTDMRHECPDEMKEWAKSDTNLLETLKEEISLSSKGESTSLVSTADLSDGVVLDTPGFKTSDAPGVPARAGHDLTYVGLMTLTGTQLVILPVLELVAGVNDLSTGAGKKSGDAQAAWFKQLLDAAGKADLEDAATFLKDAITRDDVARTLEGMQEITEKVLGSSDLFSVVLHADSRAEVVEHVLGSLAEKAGVAVVSALLPGPGWVKLAVDATDATAQFLNLGMSIFKMRIDLLPLASRMAIDAELGFTVTRTMSEADVEALLALREVDWENADGYAVLGPTGPATDAVELNTYTMQSGTIDVWGNGANAVEFVEVEYGLVGGVPVAAVAVHQEDFDRVREVPMDVFYLELFTWDEQRDRPRLHAAGRTEYTRVDETVEAADWSIEGGKLVESTWVASGVAAYLSLGRTEYEFGDPLAPVPSGLEGLRDLTPTTEEWDDLGGLSARSGATWPSHAAPDDGVPYRYSFTPEGG